MKKISLALIVLILVGICIPSVSATILYDEEIDDYVFTGESYKATDDSSIYGTKKVDRIVFKDISQYNSLSYIVIDCYTKHFSSAYPDGTHYLEYWYTSNPSVTYPLTATIKTSYNLLGQRTQTRIQLFFPEWDIGSLTGYQTIQFSDSLYDCKGSDYQEIGIRQNVYVYDGFFPKHVFTISSGKWTKNHITISDNGYDYTINLQRVYGNQYFKSDFVAKLGETIRYSDSGSDDLELKFIHSEIDLVELSTLVKTRIYPLDGEQPDTSGSVTVYVKNSQTGALIANANIVIDALVDGEYYPVVNRTEPSGIFTITLQPTGGGKPNPDGYRLIVTADGYNNPMPEINFTVDDYKNYIHCLLDPIAGGPVNENKTFIDFFVRDMKSNPIPGATVKFGKYTLITNSAGYTVFEVDKNNNYIWTISKSGYGPLTGNAVIGDSPRHTINTVLAPIVTPTITTPIPTSPPIGPTPTMTSPTGEPVSNWLEWFAAHFGMILGGGVEIGKIFMWLCFTVPVGVYVGKEAKAGAAGFMAGAGIVTLFFVLIGWVPIWLVVLLALIIGLLYAKEFNNSDTGGGR
jgi:hypothetical protein